MKKFRSLSVLFLVMTLVVTSFAFIPTLEVEAAGGVAIGGVLIQGADVVISTSGSASSEDGMFHLVASDVNQAAQAGTDVAQAPAAAGTTFTVPLNKGAANSMLYKKFTVCTMNGGALTPASNSMFITNPEACATVSARRMDYSKKGILPALETWVASKNQPRDLGATQVTLTLPLSWITAGSGVPYQYNGKTYNFETARLSGYDFSLRKYNDQGCQVSVIIVVDQNADGNFISPYSRDGLGAHNYYGLNATTTEGAEMLAAAASYLANRWTGRGFGQVDNFIIGNEVNAYTMWNYMNCPSQGVFVTEYANAFRVIYNAIKSENASANVYTCIDHQWARAEASGYMSGKGFLSTFNSVISSQGNIDWRVAAHPYSAVLTDPCAWSTTNAPHSQSAPYVTMYNLDVLTDFLSTPELLSSTGAVRSVKISELGYTSLGGEDIQAASVVYAYMVAMNNSHVDGFILSRESDHADEVAQGLAYGICNADLSKKQAYSFYQRVDDPNVIAQASAIAGVDLNSLITPR